MPVPNELPPAVLAELGRPDIVTAEHPVVPFDESGFSGATVPAMVAVGPNGVVVVATRDNGAPVPKRVALPPERP